jgi:hypothetical protein
MNLLRAYATFYNPANTLRALLGVRGDAVSRKRLLFQIVGQIGLLMTVPKLVGWARRLRRGPIEPWDGLQPARIPMIDAISSRPMNWAIEHILPADDCGVRAPSVRRAAAVPAPALQHAALPAVQPA